MVRFHTIAENRSVDHLFMDFFFSLIRLNSIKKYGVLISKWSHFLNIFIFFTRMTLSFPGLIFEDLACIHLPKGCK